jgi:hypothetical protein
MVILVFFAATISGCKKPPVDSQIFVQRQLTGLWLVKSTIYLEKKNQDTLHKDTLKIATDTVAFTKDMKYWRLGHLMDFEVDKTGENVLIKSAPDTLWHINFMRKVELEFAYIQKDTLMGDIYYKSVRRLFTKLNAY